MANMQVTDRNQFERIDLSIPSTGVRLRSGRGMAIYAVVSTLILAAGVFWVAKEVDGWASALVLGAIVLNLVGLMIAVRPNRRSPQG
jgi:O-antigen/teichoic acid export membrane protein